MSGYAGTGTVSGGDSLRSASVGNSPVGLQSACVSSLSVCHAERQRSPRRSKCTHGLLPGATVASERADCFARPETALRIAIWTVWEVVEGGKERVDRRIILSVPLLFRNSPQSTLRGLETILCNIHVYEVFCGSCEQKLNLPSLCIETSRVSKPHRGNLR